MPNGADYFASLHDNAKISSVSGIETFIHNGLVQRKTAGFQNVIHAATIKEISLRDRGKKRANFAVLRETRVPAVLIEYAFIYNTNDENILIYELEKLAQLKARCRNRMQSDWYSLRLIEGISSVNEIIKAKI